MGEGSASLGGSGDIAGACWAETSTRQRLIFAGTELTCVDVHGSVLFWLLKVAYAFWGVYFTKCSTECWVVGGKTVSDDAGCGRTVIFRFMGGTVTLVRFGR